MIEVWAHRGAKAYAPENTLPSFALAIDMGADGIELDVQLSRDGHLVVMHDETLNRTTDGTGPVVAHTLADLKELDASAGRDGYAGTRVPTLEEVLALIAGSRLKLDVELKNSEVPYPGMEEKVLAAVAAAGLTERTMYSSFNPESVRRLAGLAPQAEVGLIYSRPPVRTLRTAVSLGASAVHPDRRLMGGRRWIGRAHRRGLAVRPWVANSHSRIARLVEIGVDGFFTDAPDIGRQVRDAIAAHTAPRP